MRSYPKESGKSDSNLKIYIYDQELKLIRSGKFQPVKLEQVVTNCSLLFSINESSYYLSNSK